MSIEVKITFNQYWIIGYCVSLLHVDDDVVVI